MASSDPAPPFPSREELSRWPSTVLKDEGDHAARVVRFDLPEGSVVLKEWVPARSRLYRWMARFLMRREISHYRLLDGTHGIPRFVGAYNDTAFVMEWVDGVPLKRDLPRELLEPGLDALEEVVNAIHAKRFVHLDLHQKLNFLVGANGRVWLIDLGQGLNCRRSRSLLRHWLFPLLCRVDRRAIFKFRARYAPHTFDDSVSDEFVRKHARRRSKRWKHLHRRLRELLIGNRR
jgi:RIO-like serine/threonine protein kinase